MSVPSDERSPPRGRSRRAPGGLDAVSQDVTGTPASSLCLPVCSWKLTRWENKCISFLEELKRVGPSRSLCFRPSRGEQVEGLCAGPLAAWAPAGVCPRAGHQKPGRIGTGPGCTDEADQSASAEVSVAKAALWAPRDRRLQLAAPPAADLKRDANPTRERLARLASQRRTSREAERSCQAQSARDSGKRAMRGKEGPRRAPRRGSSPKTPQRAGVRVRASGARPASPRDKGHGHRDSTQLLETGAGLRKLGSPCPPLPPGARVTVYIL